MNVSRRNFLRVGGYGLGAAAAAASVPLSIPAFADNCEPKRGLAGAAGPILLNSNENAYGPLPSVKAAIPETLALANRYPDFHYTNLVETVAKTHKVNKDQVQVACGSTEVLKMASDAFASDGRRLVVPNPTFEAIGHYTEAEHGNVIRVPLRADYSHDLPAMLDAMGAGPGLFYICNPNNPTATLTAPAEIEEFIQKLPPKTYVLIDEAYHHFADGAPGYKSFLAQAANDDRVIVARTFSKVYGMAGLRLGYAIGTPATIKQLDTRVLEDDINCVAARAGVLSLQATAEMQAAAKRINADRAAFFAQCDKRGVKYIPSYANFAMVYCGSVANEVRNSMRASGVLIGRPFPNLTKYARISFGTPEEMDAYWKVWDSLPNCLGEFWKS